MGYWITKPIWEGSQTVHRYCSKCGSTGIDGLTNYCADCGDKKDEPVREYGYYGKTFDEKHFIKEEKGYRKALARYYINQRKERFKDE